MDYSFIGDTKQLAPELRPAMEALARFEKDVQVRTQLACSAKRWPTEVALPLIRALLEHTEDVLDKYQPLLLWWALESHVAEGHMQLRAWLKDSVLWRNPIFQNHLISRLGQRFTAERTPERLVMAAELFECASEAGQVDLLVRGMEAGLQGDVVSSVPEIMQARIAKLWKSRPHTPELLSFVMRLGYEPATAEASEQLANPSTPEKNRKLFLALLGERRVSAAVPLFLKLLREEKSESLRLELLNTLQRFADASVVQTVLELYPTLSAKLRGAAVGILSSRTEWALALLEAVEAGHVKKEQVPSTALLTIQGFNNSRCAALISKHWGRLRQSSEEKDLKMASVRKLVASGNGDLEEGRKVFLTLCSTCHTLNGEGGKIGPELTGYERDNLDFMIPAIVDPSLGIREEYTTFNVTTKDGQVLVGFIIENTTQSITLQDIGMSKMVIPREQIASSVASPISLMPEGLLDTLSEGQVRDLFRYLTKR